MNELKTLLARGLAAAQTRGNNTPCAGECGAQVPGPARICESCASRQARRELAERSLCSVPPRFQWARLTAPELVERVARRDAIGEATVARTAPRLVFTGAAGSGKTSLAIAAMCARVEALPERSSQFLSAMRLRIARSRSEDSEPALVARAMRIDHLLLDDLGNESDLPSNPLKEIVWGRFDAERSTWITTGLTLDAIAARYGDGMARRLYEHAVIIDCEGRRS